LPLSSARRAAETTGPSSASQCALADALQASAATDNSAVAILRDFMDCLLR
jgi:hypothetical protein